MRTTHPATQRRKREREERGERREERLKLSKTTMAPKQKKPLLDQQVKDQATLKVLVKDDPEVEEILGSASHVTLYGFDMEEKAWVRCVRGRGNRHPSISSSSSNKKKKAF